MRPASIGRRSDRAHLARSSEAGDIESSRRSLRKRVSLNVEPSPSARSQAEIWRPLDGVNERVIGPSSYQRIYFWLLAAAAPFLAAELRGGGCDMVTTCKVSVDDAATVTRMVSALLAELGAGHVEAGVDTQLVAELLAMKERISGFLAFAEEHPVGLIMLSESAALFARGTYGIITELYVVPDQRSSGVAMALIDAAVTLGTTKGWGQLEVGAPRQPMWNRSPNSALYLKLGFSEIGPRLKLPLHGPAQGSPAAPTRLEPRRRRAPRRAIPDSTVATFA